MNILWVTNSLLPEATAKLQGQTEIKGTGGWLLALANALIQTGDVDLTIASTSPLIKELTRVEGKRIHYFAIPFIGDSVYKTEYEIMYRIIYNQVQPDVVHIHGTEFPHSLAALRACGPERTVVSVQGLASVISRYYFAGLSNKEIRRNPSVHDFLRQNLFQQKREMEIRGRYEIMLLKEAKNVIGRTCWDRAHVWAVNPHLNYFHCDEVLRHEFYEGDRWSYEKCVKHSLFLSQGNYPLKGIHKVIEALAIVKRNYPSVSVRIAGLDITCSKGGLKSKIKITTYGKIINKLIKDNNLEDNITFLGALNAEEMKKEYLLSNAFICPSSIENSPNSLCEAQILGVPVLASYAGGIPDLMKGNEEHLYRFDEVELLAEKICALFDCKDDIDTRGLKATAIQRHNVSVITKTMLEIYHKVLSD